jgi:probable rRNA maturation factor
MIPSVHITVDNKLWRRCKKVSSLTKSAIRACVDAIQVDLQPHAEVSVLLCTDEKIRELNARWRQIDKATNVLSFPNGNLATNLLLGDIAVAYETVEREALSEKKSFEDHYAHMVVHGFLHILGFDHETEVDATRMEAHERTILKQMNIEDPYRMLDVVEAPHQ